ncbi:hypothetical protein B0I37DRAFT_25737 [Chaetomium sp. MPI-CAGE-AT-0009]|nr:hypothetical protein B0I37DRAFT_25737 [Chaetomium sp. MPI-CAGE-AT-0009]
MAPLPVPCHRGFLNSPAITRQPCLTSSQLLSVPPSRRCIHHTAPLWRGEYWGRKKRPWDHPPDIRKPQASKFIEPTRPSRPLLRAQQLNDASKPSTEPDPPEQRRVVYNKDGHEPSIQPFMSHPSGKIPSRFPPRYSLPDSWERAKTIPPPKETLAAEEAPAREETAFQKEALSMDPLMLFYGQAPPAKGNGGPAAVGDESKPQTDIAAEAKGGGTGSLADKEQQLDEKARRLEELEQRLNALMLKLEEENQKKEEEKQEKEEEKQENEEEEQEKEEDSAEAEKEHNHWATMQKADSKEKTWLSALRSMRTEEGPASSKQRMLMGVVMLKRRQLEKDIRIKPKENGWLRRADRELRLWILENNLHTMIDRKPREVRRQGEIMDRQRLLLRKKLRIPPEFPDPNPQVEAALDKWLSKRDAQTLIRKSKEIIRKQRKNDGLAQKARHKAWLARKAILGGEVFGPGSE